MIILIKYIVSYMETKLVGSKSGAKKVFTYTVTTLYRAEILRSMTTIKYSVLMCKDVW